MRLLYTAIFTLCIPLILVRLWWRGKKVPAYRQRWRERFGFIPPRQNDRPTLWVHTVSVGEFIAARPMLDKLLQLESYNVAITTTTPTGSERVTEAYGNKVYHCYLPYDLPFCLAPFFKRINPTIAIFLPPPSTAAINATSPRFLPTAGFRKSQQRVTKSFPRSPHPCSKN